MKILPRPFTALACFFVSLCAASANPPEQKPNIIFILADDLGKEWISAYGSESIQTPHIDSLAKHGVKFDNFYAMPQCTPSRIALLTGKYPCNNGWVNHWDAPRWGGGFFDWNHPQNTTVFRLMQRQGYKTAAAGKWQINDFRKEPDAMAHHGFDDWFMWTGYEDGNPVSEQRYANPYIHSREGSREYPGAFGPDLYAGFLIDFIRKHKSAPFLLYYATCLPHDPLVATPDEPGATSPMEKHKAMVRYLDKLVGHIVATVKEEGLEKRTIIFFTTDNGSGRAVTGVRNGHPVQGAKMKLTEAGTCMPFIAHAPGRFPAGTESTALADLTDILPTFLDLAGASVPDAVKTDGVSMLPVLTGKSSDSSREWILSLGGGNAVQKQNRVRNVKDFAPRVLRDKTYKVWVSEQRKIIRLHNLEIDPGEKTNLIKSTASAEVAALEKFQKILATLPAQDANPVYTPRE